MVALCVNDLFEEITQQAEDILNSNLAFKTKLDQAFALCQEKMSQQISDYFQDKMVEDSVFSTLLTKAITAKNVTSIVLIFISEKQRALLVKTYRQS